MHPFKSTILFLALFFCAILAHAAPGDLSENNGNNTNPHNLSSLSNNPIKAETETQICVFCHIPHGASYQSPLWSRMEPMGGPFPTFAEANTQDPTGRLGIIDPGIIGVTEYGSEYPNGASKMCLSCHDGVTAIGTLLNGDFISVVNGASGGIGANMRDVGSTMHFDTANGGTLFLDRSHPISFVYTQQVADYLSTTAGLKTFDFTLPTTIALDSNNRVQCTICHDPHTDTRASNALPFWRKNTGNSASDYSSICQECHSTTYYSGPDHNYP